MVPEEIRAGELVAFDPSNAAIEFEAVGVAEFVLGSAVAQSLRPRVGVSFGAYECRGAARGGGADRENQGSAA